MKNLFELTSELNNFCPSSVKNHRVTNLRMCLLVIPSKNENTACFYFIFAGEYVIRIFLCGSPIKHFKNL